MPRLRCCLRSVLAAAWGASAPGHATAPRPAGTCAPVLPTSSLHPSPCVLFACSTNSSYGRWDEARKMWGQVVNRSRDIARQVGSCVGWRAVQFGCQAGWAPARQPLSHSHTSTCNCNTPAPSPLPAGAGLHPCRTGAPAGCDLPMDHCLYVSEQLVPAGWISVLAQLARGCTWLLW